MLIGPEHHKYIDIRASYEQKGINGHCDFIVFKSQFFWFVLLSCPPLFTAETYRYLFITLLGFKVFAFKPI